LPHNGGDYHRTTVNMTPSLGKCSWVAIISIALCCVRLAHSIELTFELQDKAKDCYYEIIERNTSTTLEYQVGTARARPRRRRGLWLNGAINLVTALVSGRHRRPV